jgi:hypothetical protein
MNDVNALRVSYWLGAIGDFVYAIVILIPSRAGVSEYVYPMGLFAAVAFSWGIMLILATRKPLERRWVLIPTIVVIALLCIANVYSYLIAAIDLNVIVPRVLLGLAIIAFMLFSYLKTRDVSGA